jgi:DNA-binding GntR family transcriptional regulator
MDAGQPLREHQDLTERVYEEIRRRIVHRELLPEQRLVTDDLARLLGVSRTPVKLALQRLAVEGLVNEAPRRGASVAGLSAVDIEELFDLRLMYELHAAERAVPRLTPDRLQALRTIIDTLSHLSVDDTFTNYDAFVAADHRFHATLVGFADNRRLIRLYEQLNIHLHVARAFYARIDPRARAVHREHLTILGHCERGEVAPLQAALRQHIETGRAFVLRTMRDFGRTL